MQIIKITINNTNVTNLFTKAIYYHTPPIDSVVKTSSLTFEITEAATHCSTLIHIVESLLFWSWSDSSNPHSLNLLYYIE